MKRYFTKSVRFLGAALLAATLLFNTSCNDFLELLPPDGLVEDEYWNKKEDVQAVLMGAYQTFAKLQDELFLYGELRGDMLEVFNADVYMQEIIFGNIEPNNTLCEWNQFYEVINYCNYVLKYAPEVQKIDKTFTDFQRRAFEAEAIYLRSLSYFYLIRVFKDVPLVFQPTDSDGADFFPSKTADTTIARIIKNDLKSVINVVKEDYGDIKKNKGRANKGAIYALLADISLWNFEYDECLQHIGNIDEMGLYDLLLPGDYFSLYYPGNSLESIYEIQFDQSSDQRSYITPLVARTNGDFRASLFAIENLSPEFSGEIIRGNAAIGRITETDYIIWKYTGTLPDGLSNRGGADNNSQNWIIYRYADILLMKAEALSQKPGPDYAGALNIINQIRARALLNSITVPENPASFEDAILLERAKELAYEGKRWFDLMRMGRRNDFARKDNLIRVLIEDVSSSQRLVLASKLTDPNGWYLPIHFNELESNGNLEQNPFYQSYQEDAR